MVKVYGYSDDLVEIEGSQYKEDEIDCYDRNVRLRFSDGTVILISYSKSWFGIWKIEVEQKGTAEQWLTTCVDQDPDEDPYSDVLELDAEVVGHEVVDK